MSLESLARGLDESKPRLEDVIANVEPCDEGDLRQLRKLSEDVKTLPISTKVRFSALAIA